MVAALIVLAILLSLALVALAALARQHLGRVGSTGPVRDTSARRILFPVAERGLSARALEAALRLAKAERATLVPTFIAIIPAHLSLDVALTREPRIATLPAAVEQRAADFGVPWIRESTARDRHALRRTVARECFNKIVIAASANGSPGFDTDDVAWLLDHVVGEIVVLRLTNDEQLRPPTDDHRYGGAPEQRQEHWRVTA